MKYRVRIPFPLILWMLATPMGYAQTLSLQEAVDLALANSEELRIARAEVEKAEFEAKRANARRFPRLDFIGQYLYTSEVMKMVQPPQTVDLGIYSFTVPGLEIAFGDEHTAEFKLQVTQPLFAGFGLKKSVCAARRMVEVERIRMGRVEWDLRCRVEEAYIRCQKTAAAVEAARIQVTVLKRHLDSIERRLKEGLVSDEAFSRAEYALHQSELTLQEAEHQDQLAWVALRELIGLPPDTPKPQLKELEERSLELLPEDTESDALTHRWEIRELQVQLEVLGEQEAVQKASYYPSLTALGSFNYGRPGVDRLANEWMHYGTAGVSLNWTLWDWGGRRVQVERFRAAARQIEESLAAFESRIRQEIARAKLDLEDARTRMDLAGKSEALAEKVLGWVQERYQEGVASEEEYLDALDECTRSELQRIMALADYRLALVGLKRAYGFDVFP